VRDPEERAEDVPVEAVGDHDAAAAEERQAELEPLENLIDCGNCTTRTSGKCGQEPTRVIARHCSR
jgi:hypothetical protein